MTERDESVTALLELLDLQDAGQGVFVGASERTSHPRIFGGQLLAQALAAASFTSPPDWPCHSLHAYFVRPGVPGRPIDYEVMALRDGQTFIARKVVAVQRDEVALELLASFAPGAAPRADAPGAVPRADAPGAVPRADAPGAAPRADAPGIERRTDSHAEPDDPEHQLPAPEAPAPESFPSEQERDAEIRARGSAQQRAFLERRRAIEFIWVDSRWPGDVPPRAGPTRSWLRVRSPLPDDPNLHRCALAYASDFGPLEPSLRAIGAGFGDAQMQVASLDHALWFHRPFRCDEWLLFTLESVSVAEGRGLSRGTVHDRAGRLVASVSQEGVMRKRDPLAAT